MLVATVAIALTSAKPQSQSGRYDPNYNSGRYQPQNQFGLSQFGRQQLLDRQHNYALAQRNVSVVP